MRYVTGLSIGGAFLWIAALLLIPYFVSATTLERCFEDDVAVALDLFMRQNGGLAQSYLWGAGAVEASLKALLAMPGDWVAETVKGDSDPFYPLAKFWQVGISTSPYWQGLRALLTLIIWRSVALTLLLLWLSPVWVVLTIDALITRARRIAAMKSPSPLLWAFGGAGIVTGFWVTGLLLFIPNAVVVMLVLPFTLPLLFWWMLGHYHALP
ncbi:MAG: hypothetical protein SOR95_05930 [Sutterella sp.]|nr:hypothetical protein [Sutterella sp.]